MAEFAIALGAVALGVLAIVGYDAFRRPGDERDPEQPHNVARGSAQSEAEAAAPVSEMDEEAAAPLLAYVEEIGSGELPALAFDADPLGAPIPAGLPVAAPAEFIDTTANWLSCFAWPTTPAPSVPLSSVQVCEPDRFEPEGPTGVFPADWIAKVLAGGPR